MKTYTENEKHALATSLRTFIGYLNGSTMRAKEYYPLVCKVLDAGITLEELYNPENFVRAMEVHGGKPDSETYFNMLIERQMDVRDMKDETDWDEPYLFTQHAEAFHDFFMELCPKAGPWSTLDAKTNLLNAIRQYGIGTIFSEALIWKVMEKTGIGNELTCCQYIEELLNNGEHYNIDKTMINEEKPVGIKPVVNPDACLSTEGCESDTDESIFWPEYPDEDKQ